MSPGSSALDPAASRPCPGCGEARPALPLCGRCGALQPCPPALDPFAALGLQRGLALGDRAIEEAYKARARQLHPDRFVQAGEVARVQAARWSTAVADARARLRDPARRACLLLGIAEGAAGEAVMRAVALPEGLLEKVLARREAAGRSEGRAALVAEVEADHSAAFARLGDAFEVGDRGEALAALAVLRFHARTLDALRKAEEVEP